MEELEERGTLCDRKNERGDQGECQLYDRHVEVAEMRMLRCMDERSSKLNKIRNEIIMGTTKVWEISKKVQKRRLKLYRHVMRRE